MKTFSNLGTASRARQAAGSVLVIAIIFCALIGLILVAYLSMVKTQHKFTFRAQTWNNCIPMCEAGVEEAMAHINHINTTSNFAINGWVLTGGFYRKERSLNGGTIRMAVDTLVPPTITVTGYLRAPVQSNLLVRAVRVKTRINYKFNYAMLGKGTIDISGGSMIDSYNSTDPAKSGPGGVYDPARRTADAMVATSSKLPGSVKIGNLDIYGSVAVGPGGSVDKTSGTIGDVAWVTNPINDGQIQPGHFTDDVNLYIPDVQMPTPFAGLPPLGGIVGGVMYDYILGNGDWALPSMSGHLKILVTGKARLYVAGSTTIGNAGSIDLTSAGSLEFFSRGNIDIKGGVNNPGLPKNLSFLGLPSCNLIGINAGGAFNCSIYAPQADVTVSGNGEGAGAVVANTFKLTGGMRWHYDEGLKGDPLEGRYVAASWTEL